MHFSEKLRLLMRRHGLTQTSLGSHLGVSQRAVGKWLAEDSMPGADVAKRLAEHFEITVDSLLDDTRELPPNPRVLEMEARYAAVAAAVAKIPADQPAARQDAFIKLTERDHFRLTLKETAKELRALADKIDPPATISTKELLDEAEAAATLERLKSQAGVIIHQQGAGKLPRHG